MLLDIVGWHWALFDIVGIVVCHHIIAYHCWTLLGILLDVVWALLDAHLQWGRPIAAVDSEDSVIAAAARTYVERFGSFAALPSGLNDTVAFAADGTNYLLWGGHDCNTASWWIILIYSR